jgi:hypothetical protein
VRVAEGLQTDFSLNQALSLYLVETLFQLDPASETYALDVVTLVEAILENPKQILLKQQDKARQAMYLELKAQGTEYDELKAKLDEVTWPKPLEEFIYLTFNEFAKRHPWVGENVRPKGIVRDMIERYAGFNDTVKEYGLERSEGLLLRYLSDFYKTLVQTVPEARKDDPVLDVEAWCRSLLARVDSSLVEEWESLLGVRADKPLSDELVQARGHPGAVVALDRDARTFNARVRAELHAFVRALANSDVTEALARVRPGWDDKRLTAELAPFLAEHGRVRFDPQARLARYTTVHKDGDGRYRARQVLLGKHEDESDANADDVGNDDVNAGADSAHDWMIEAAIDLHDRKSADEPLLELVRIGR